MIENKNKKSLLIVGFPQGGTTTTYELAYRATGLAAYRRRQRSGEVLNKDRFPGHMRAWPQYARGANDQAFAAAAGILDRHAAEPWAIKDVVQPWLVRRYLAARPDAYHVIFVDRPIRDVIATRLKNHPDRVVAPSIRSNLVACRQMFLDLVEEIGGATVGFPEVLFSRDVLATALRGLGLAHKPIELPNQFRTRAAKKVNHVAAIAAKQKQAIDAIEQRLADEAPKALEEFR